MRNKLRNMSVVLTLVSNLSVLSCQNEKPPQFDPNQGNPQPLRTARQPDLNGKGGSPTIPGDGVFQIGPGGKPSSIYHSDGPSGSFNCVWKVTRDRGVREVSSGRAEKGASAEVALDDGETFITNGCQLWVGK